MKTAFDYKNYLNSAPEVPGVYEMFDLNQTHLYIGKAKNLKKRITQYFQTGLSTKTLKMTTQICNIKTTITQNEAEALILEQNLIKKFRPKYNILLKDDASYPYIRLNKTHNFPGFYFHRGKQNKNNIYFGPFPSISLTRELLQVLQQVFQIRNCTDNMFNNRTRPCLQYQIKRCSAPCVNKISIEEYKKEIELGTLFLNGKQISVIEHIQEIMDSYSQKLQYELAAKQRDKIAKLRTFQKQHVETTSGDADVFTLKDDSFLQCVQMLSIRSGQILGGKHWFHKIKEDTDESDVLRQSIEQHYLTEIAGENLPKCILTNIPVTSGIKVVEEAIKTKYMKTIKIVYAAKAKEVSWVNLSLNNAKQNLISEGKKRKTVLISDRLSTLQKVLGLKEAIKYIKCFDISHTQGQYTTASCVTFSKSGIAKGQYRVYRIKGNVQGDDYAAMQEAVNRHYKERKVKGEEVLVIDGGKGQLSAVLSIIGEIKGLTILAIAKGKERINGKEKIYAQHNGNIPLPWVSTSPEFQVLQQIRDEAHRFAKKHHSLQRDKINHMSALDKIKGIGVKRKQLLIRHFIHLENLKKASRDEIASIPTFNVKLADIILESLRAQLK